MKIQFPIMSMRENQDSRKKIDWDLSNSRRSRMNKRQRGKLSKKRTIWVTFKLFRLVKVNNSKSLKVPMLKRNYLMVKVLLRKIWTSLNGADNRILTSAWWINPNLEEAFNQRMELRFSKTETKIWKINLTMQMNI